MREEAVERPGRFSGFLGGVRLIFDACLFALVLLIIGFIVFANSVDREHSVPQRSADGIAVLTGGMSRIDEAMKLLAEGKAKRVLITGVNRTTTTEELKELASQGDQYFTCCVDIDKEARNTIDNATETSEWVALHHYGSIIVVTSNYHMPRALAELARVMPGVTLIPYSGGRQQCASRALVDVPRHDQAAPLRIFEISAGAHPARRDQSRAPGADGRPHHSSRRARAVNGIEPAWRARCCSMCCSM